MRLTGKIKDMNFINDFFGFLFRYYSFEKGEYYGFYSTIFSISALISMNILFFEGMFLFQLVDKRSILFNFPQWEKVAVPTLIILINYWYFKSRYNSISKQYNSYSVKKKNIIRVWSLLYIVITVIFSIFSIYSVRNNIRWW